MLDALSIIAKFLDSRVNGLPVHAYFGPLSDFIFDHPVGALLLRIEEGRLTVELVFRDSPQRCAGDYLKMVEDALAEGVPMDAGETLTFTFERNIYLFTDRIGNLDYHASTYLITQPKPAPLDLKPEYKQKKESK